MIEKPSAGGIVEASWGIDVANAVNKIGVGMVSAWSSDVLLQPGTTHIIPFQGATHNARLFLSSDGTVKVTEGRRGVYIVTAYLMFTGLALEAYARGYLYHNGNSFAGAGIFGAGGSGIAMSMAGIDQFEEGDALTVRVNVSEECTVDVLTVSMLRIAENS